MTLQAPLRTQPVLAPTAPDRLRELVDAGVLVDLAGRVLRRQPCSWCPDTTLGETCPRSLPCPTCGQGPGSPCSRPSGHVLSAGFGGTHDSRSAAAELQDQARQITGDPALPAPWSGQAAQ